MIIIINAHKNEIHYLFFLLTPLFAFSQIKEIVTDGHGKVVTDQDKEIGEKEPDKLLDIFYENQEQINELDRLLSFRFYQQMPYVKFKEMMEKKNEVVGKYKNRELIKVDKQESGLKIIYDFSVTYEKRNTTEQITLIRETEKSNFEIVGYRVD